MKVTRVQAVQVHYVPNMVYQPDLDFDDDDNLIITGLLDSSVTKEPEIVYEYESEYDEAGGNVPIGGTAQNNFSEVKTYVCKYCHARVKGVDIESHECED